MIADPNLPSASGAELATLAATIATEVGAFLLAQRSVALGAPESVATKSSPNDFVTTMDTESQRRIERALATARPNDRFLGEESGPAFQMPTADGDLLWIVDPIDGTANYVRGYPMWSVSIAVWDLNGPVAGAISIPTLGETFAASRGDGCACNGERVRVSRPRTVETMIVATGYSYSATRRKEQHTAASRWIASVADIRRSGSAAADLCSVACGRVDLYTEGPLSIWDFAAGQLIASEAGADVTVSASGSSTSPTFTVTAGSPEAQHIFSEL